MEKEKKKKRKHASEHEDDIPSRDVVTRRLEHRRPVLLEQRAKERRERGEQRRVRVLCQDHDCALRWGSKLAMLVVMMGEGDV